MQRIIIPTHYVHTRSTPLWTKETARPLSGAAIWMPAPGRASTLVSR
ncbi:putative tellurite resistance protein [Klebsiella pneumoniae]|nr:putative tellurite resistance protein [Klebsiella pneumoniae]